MSFLNHIGLGFLDPTNELDKAANAIKSGDVSAIIKQLKVIFDGVEDRLGDISDLFEDAAEDAKKGMRRELTQAKRRMIREAREELSQLQERFGDTLAEAMKPMIAELVEAEVERRLRPAGH